jgi:ABC-type glycerol-3-phosphate transport system substrate-binding protein
MKANGQLRWALAASSVLAALALAAASSSVQAQTKASVSNKETVSAHAVVKSVDPVTRHVVMTSDKGETVSVKAPAEVRNFDKLKPGDKVAVRYTVETEYVLSAANTALPKDTAAMLEARAAKGGQPGAYAANHIIVTGAIIAIDAAKHTLKLVSPQGGAVHTVAVHTDAGRRAMAQMKVGDTITAYVTESLLLTVAPG